MTNMQFVLLMLARSLESRLGCQTIHIVSVDLVQRAREELLKQGINWDADVENLRGAFPPGVR